MAKRFTDTAKWNKPFLRSLKAPYKLLWLYLLDECDHAGVWEVDLSVAEIKIGEKLKSEIALSQFGDRIITVGNKWFVPDFIEFQYGELDPKNRVHNSVIKVLSKYNLMESDGKIKGLVSPLTSPLQGDKDKDKDMDKEKDKDEGGVGETALKLCIGYWTKEFHPDWSFEPIHGKKIKDIITKIKKLMVVNGKETTPVAIYDSFVFMCKNLPEWYKDKDLSKIESGFNEIIEQIKNGKPTRINKTRSAAEQAVHNIIAAGGLDPAQP